MPFCRVYHNEKNDDYFSFEGFFQEGDNTIYAAVNPKSDAFKHYRTLEPFDVRGGRALFTMSDYLKDCEEHYDTAIYKYGDLYGTLTQIAAKLSYPYSFRMPVVFTMKNMQWFVILMGV
jgi:hypothetical protein